MYCLGQRIVFGIPTTIQPIMGLPPGQVRLRFRNNSFGRAYVRDQTGIRQFTILVADDGQWFVSPQVETGRNCRR